MIKTNKSPAFQFYPADFMSDENVAVMTNHECGCYIKLLCFCWIEGSIPSNIKSIARILRETEQDMMILWQAIGPCFVQGEDEGRLRHPRLDAEREKQAAYKSKKSQAGKAGMSKRWGDREERPLPLWQQEVATDTPKTVSPIAPAPVATPPAVHAAEVSIEPKPKKTKASQHIDVPDGVNPEIYADFIKVRTRKSAPFTLTALRGFMAEAQKANVTLDEAFSVCCNKGWVGFEAAWYANLTRSQQSNRSNYPTKGGIEGSMSSDEYRTYMLKELGVADERTCIDAQTADGLLEVSDEGVAHG